MVQCRSGFSVVDTMNISTHSNFSRTSELLSQHEDATIVGRTDMALLLNKKVKSKQISSELADSFIQNAKRRYSLSHLQKYAQGATYVNFKDMIDIQLLESNSNEQQITMINDEPGRGVVELDARRFWQYSINLLQTQDYNGFGTQFMPIPMFKTNDNPSAPTWILFSLISGSKELWQVINTKKSL